MNSSTHSKTSTAQPSPAHSHNQITQSQNKHLERLEQLNNFIQTLNTKFQKQVQILEGVRLQEFKQDLIKTKSEFELINQKRNDNAIKKQIYQRKKILDKECACFLEKSMEFGKVCENLRSKLVEMESNQQQLKHEIVYLEKQIVNSKRKHGQLEKQAKQIEEWLKKEKKQISDKKDRKNSGNSLAILGDRTNISFLPSSKICQKTPQQISAMKTRTQKFQHNSQTRLQQKLDSTKQFLNSLIFEQSTLEQIFTLYDPQCYQSEKKKLALMEKMLEQDCVKRAMYRLLFQSNDNNNGNSNKINNLSDGNKSKKVGR